MSVDEEPPRGNTDWKAKLREQVEGLKRQAEESTAARWVLVDVLALIDALPDPPTPDPDAPPMYEPPEGHYIVLGKNVPDGWEGRTYNVLRDSWWPASECRRCSDSLFEVRRVPAPEPATEWVPWWDVGGKRPAAVDDDHQEWRDRVDGVKKMGKDVLFFTASTSVWHTWPVRADGCVEVLAEGERS